MPAGCLFKFCISFKVFIRAVLDESSTLNDCLFDTCVPATRGCKAPREPEQPRCEALVDSCSISDRVGAGLGSVFGTRGSTQIGPPPKGHCLSGQLLQLTALLLWAFSLQTSGLRGASCGARADWGVLRGRGSCGISQCLPWHSPAAEYSCCLRRSKAGVSRAPAG